MQGALHLDVRTAPGATPLPVAEFLARNYASISRQAAVLIGSLTMFERPMLFARFVPSEENGAWVEGTLLAERFHREAAPAFEARNLVMRARLPLWSSHEVPFAAFVSAEEASLPRKAAGARGLEAWIGTRVKIDRFGPSLAGPIEVRRGAANLTAAGLTISDPVLEMGRAALGAPGAAHPALAGLQGRLLGLLWSDRIAVEGDIDPRQGSGRIGFNGAVAADAVGFIGQRVKKDLGRWIRLTTPLALRATADFGPGWKLLRAEGEDGRRRI